MIFFFSKPLVYRRWKGKVIDRELLYEPEKCSEAELKIDEEF